MPEPELSTGALSRAGSNVHRSPYCDAAGFDVVLALDSDTAAHVHLGRGQGRLAVACRDRDAIDAVTDDLLRCLRDPAPSQDRVALTFWSTSVRGLATTSRRHLDAPTWAPIASN